MPAVYAELFGIQERLEKHFRDMQDLEFTVEAGKLYLLQTRAAKRSASASVRVAVDMVQEGLLHPDEALLRVEPERLSDLLFPTLAPEPGRTPDAIGLAGSPGAVTGHIAFDAAQAVDLAEGQDVILVRIETSPEDLHGMKAAKGILTVRGGATSHAAIVARGMGRPCVVGCGALTVDAKNQTVTIHAADGSVTATLGAGEVITIDGGSGGVYAGAVPTREADLGSELETLLSWTRDIGHMDVRANADTGSQAERARQFGAQGIGLCRTEHMFFSEERILRVRQMILASSVEKRKEALEKLLPFQQKDFEELLRVMEGLPVNIRLLDPPLHEFLPQDAGQIAEVARELGVSPQAVAERVEQLHEFNPMLGHRGVRLAITFPEIPQMQVRAILQAACAVAKEGKKVLPEIMIPLALSGAELKVMKDIVTEVAEEVFAKEGRRIDFHFGTMIELPRAALLADELAEEAEFFSFGTNDLTQTCFGVSRDDAGSFLPEYLERHILKADPFSSLDQAGVGELVRIAVEKGKAARPGIHLGVCGEHGGDPASIEFCHRVGLDYVSCSPFRVPIARLVAAQAAIRAAEEAASIPPV
jgi:pyruvate,orthophosphate dikinase